MEKLEKSNYGSLESNNAANIPSESEHVPGNPFVKKPSTVMTIFYSCYFQESLQCIFADASTEQSTSRRQEVLASQRDFFQPGQSNAR